MRNGSNAGDISLTGTACALVAGAAVAVAALMIGHRYQPTTATADGRAYRLDRLTGKVSALAPRAHTRPAPRTSVELPRLHHKREVRLAVIDLTREAGAFQTPYRPAPTARKGNLVLGGWRVYAIRDDRLVPWERASEPDVSTDKYLTSCTYAVLENGIPQDTLGRC